MYSMSLLKAAASTALIFATTTTCFVIPPTDPYIISRNINDKEIVRRAAASGPVNQLLAIVPSASTCNGAPYASECATASAALSPILDSFVKYSITTAPEQAALLSWMAYETADFKYNMNHFPSPGRPGQGTRTMMSPTFVKQYVASLPDVASQASGKSDADVLALVADDEHSFASAAWFYSTQCSAAVKTGVQTGSRAGWAAFVGGCVGTTVDEGTGDQSREAYWRRAMAALGSPTS